MKHRLTIIGCLLGLAGHSQYFVNRYGTAVQEEIGTGMFTTMAGSGHILSARRVHSTGSELVLVRTDASGTIPAAPYFRNRYKMYNNSSMNYVQDVLQTVTLELDANTFGVVGTCSYDPSTGQQAIYYSKIDASGNYVLSNTYVTGNTGSMDYELKGARLAPGGTEFYVTGMVSAGAQSYAVVMKLEIATGNIVWAWSYMVDPSVTSGEPECGYDLVENPATGELLVVGYRHVCTNTSDDAFVMHLDPASGNVVAPTEFYGDPNSIDVFTSIELMSSGEGYCTGGWSGAASGVLDSWTLSFDNAGGVNWSTLHDYNNAIVPNYTYDIKEHVTAGQPVLYALGRTETGVLGQSDVEVYEIDAATGNSTNQFTYGNSRNDFAYSLSENASASGGNGLGIYAMRDYGATSLFDLILYKTHFNGVTGCEYDIRQIESREGPGFLYRVNPVIIDEFVSSPNFMQLSGTVNAAVNCVEQPSPAGYAPLAGSAVVTLLQPVDGDNYQLQVVSEETMPFDVELRDLKGNLLLTFPGDRIEAGENLIGIDVSRLGLATGIYLVQWSGGTQSGSEKLIIH
jgi:hypothetical protein